MTGRRDYNGNSKVTDEDFGRREEDKIGISKMFDVMIDIQREVSEVKQVLNNGIVSKTEDNTEAIENLSCEISDVKKFVKEKEDIKKGKMSMFQILVTIVSSVGATVVTLLTILYYLGVIW